MKMQDIMPRGRFGGASLVSPVGRAQLIIGVFIGHRRAELCAAG